MAFLLQFAYPGMPPDRLLVFSGRDAAGLNLLEANMTRIGAKNDELFV